MYRFGYKFLAGAVRSTQDQYLAIRDVKIKVREDGATSADTTEASTLKQAHNRCESIKVK